MTDYDWQKTWRSQRCGTRNWTAPESRDGPYHVSRLPWPTGRTRPTPVGRSVILRHQYQRLELTSRSWKLNPAEATAVMHLAPDQLDFLESEKAYITLADQVVSKRADLVLACADAIDRLAVDRRDQAQWIRLPFPPAANRTTLSILQLSDQNLGWFVSFVSRHL